MEDGKIYYTVIDNICVIKMVGRIAYKISPNFDRFIEKIKNNSTVNNFVVDLREAAHIDSTNLGLLAKLNRYSRTKSARPPTVISTKDNINHLLLNIGFAAFFDIVDNMGDMQSTLKKLPHMKNAGEKITRVMLEAHRELANMNDTNHELFKDVINYLEGDTDETAPPKK